jgi:hypothetical protein
MITDLSAALVAILILAIYSYAFLGGSIVYELVTDLAVASSIGYQAITSYETAIRTGWTPLTTNFAVNWHYIIAMILSVLLFTIVIGRRWTWIARWPSSIMLGVGLGLGMSGLMYADVYQQIVSSWTLGLGQLEWIIVIVGMPLTLWYFVFTVPHGKGIASSVVDRAADIGKAFAMIFICSKYAGSVVFRLILSVGCLQRVLWDWLGLSAPIFK